MNLTPEEKRELLATIAQGILYGALVSVLLALAAWLVLGTLRACNEADRPPAAPRDAGAHYDSSHAGSGAGGSYSPPRRPGSYH